MQNIALIIIIIRGSDPTLEVTAFKLKLIREWWIELNGIINIVMNLEAYETKIEEVLSIEKFRMLPRDSTTTIEERIYTALKKHASNLSGARRMKV